VIAGRIVLLASGVGSVFDEARDHRVVEEGAVADQLGDEAAPPRSGDLLEERRATCSCSSPQ
jgi:hypothetical protein